MKQIIKDKCRELEKEQGIRILFAVENGSRAWRMESKDSDYDVRFVYARPVSNYLCINPSKEVIEKLFDEKGNLCTHKEAVIDMVGFDVIKYAKLLHRSNPTAIEWLISDIVYYGKQNKAFLDFALNNFSSKRLYHHYKSLSRNNYLKYIKSESNVTYKRYLYTYRGLVNAKWVAHKKTAPPIMLAQAVKEMKGVIPEKIMKKLEEIIKIKSEGKEKDKIQNIKMLDEYAEEFLRNESETPEEKEQSKPESLNKEIQKIILET